MKSFKFFAVLFIMFGLATSTMNAQQANTPPLRFVYWNYYTLDIPCLGETISGILDFDVMVLNQKWQGKRSGIMTGEISRNKYTIEWIGKQISMKRLATIWTEPFTILIRLDGKLVANVHVVLHWTINANGDLTAAFYTGHCDLK